MMISVYGRIENIVGTAGLPLQIFISVSANSPTIENWGLDGRKCWFAVFSAFSIMFQEGLFYMVVKPFPVTMTPFDAPGK